MFAVRFALCSLVVVGAVAAGGASALACSCLFAAEQMILPMEVTTTSDIVLRLTSSLDDAAAGGYSLVSDLGVVQLEVVDAIRTDDAMWVTVRPAEALTVGTTYALEIDNIIPGTDRLTTLGSQLFHREVVPTAVGGAELVRWLDVPTVSATRSHPSTSSCGFEVSATLAAPHDGAPSFFRADYALLAAPTELNTFVTPVRDQIAWIGATQCSGVRPFEAGESYLVTLSLWIDGAWAPATAEPIQVTLDPM